MKMTTQKKEKGEGKETPCDMEIKKIISCPCKGFLLCLGVGNLSVLRLVTLYSLQGEANRGITKLYKRSVLTVIGERMNCHCWTK